MREVHIERPKRRRQDRLHGLVVDLNPSDFFLLAIARVEDREPVDGVALCSLVHDEAFEREDHIVSRERNAVRPLNIPEVKGNFLAVRRCLPRFGQPWPDSIGDRVQLDQTGHGLTNNGVGVVIKRTVEQERLWRSRQCEVKRASADRFRCRSEILPLNEGRGRGRDGQ